MSLEMNSRKNDINTYMLYICIYLKLRFIYSLNFHIYLNTLLPFKLNVMAFTNNAIPHKTV